MVRGGCILLFDVFQSSTGIYFWMDFLDSWAPFERGRALKLCSGDFGRVGILESEKAELGGIDVAYEIAELCGEHCAGKDRGRRRLAGCLGGGGLDSTGVPRETVDLVRERRHVIHSGRSASRKG